VKEKGKREGEEEKGSSHFPLHSFPSVSIEEENRGGDKGGGERGDILRLVLCWREKAKKEGKRGVAHDVVRPCPKRKGRGSKKDAVASFFLAYGQGEKNRKRGKKGKEKKKRGGRYEHVLLTSFQ